MSDGATRGHQGEREMLPTPPHSSRSCKMNDEDERIRSTRQGLTFLTVVLALKPKNPKSIVVCIPLMSLTFLVVLVLKNDPSNVSSRQVYTYVEALNVTGSSFSHGLIHVERSAETAPPPPQQINTTAVRIEQEQRQARIGRVCAEEGVQPTQRMWHYKMDTRRGLIYCPIPKAGWSSWKRLFFYLNGVINSTDDEIGVTPDYVAKVSDIYAIQIRRLQAQQHAEKMNYFFTFVRNPWTRLISAYINKAVDWNYTRILHTPCAWEAMSPYQPPISFAQFVTCIAERAAFPGVMDVHWSPMSRLCDFCSIHYDHIGHLETVEEDSRYVLQQNGIDARLPRVFASKAHRPAEVQSDWYSKVPLDVIQKLRQLYRFDFLLHGYSDVPPGWEGRLS